MDKLWINQIYSVLNHNAINWRIRKHKQTLMFRTMLLMVFSCPRRGNPSWFQQNEPLYLWRCFAFHLMDKCKDLSFLKALSYFNKQLGVMKVINSVLCCQFSLLLNWTPSCQLTHINQCPFTLLLATTPFSNKRMFKFLFHCICRTALWTTSF